MWEQLRRRDWGAAAVAYAAASAALWPWPVLGILHAESSAVLAGVAFFTAGTHAVGALRRIEAPRLGTLLGGHLALTALPWALMTLTLLWRPNCGYGQGLLLFLVFVPPSAVLGVAAAWALTGVGRGRVALWGLGLAVATFPVAYDLGLHPQFYTYNHVWGGVLGPVYDEELAVRPGLFAFRALTGLWSLWLILLGARAQSRERMRGYRLSVAAVSLSIGVAYLLSGRLGFNTPASALERALPGEARVGPFVLRYDPAALDTLTQRALLDDLVYGYGIQSLQLDTEVDEPITVYLYPSTDVKAALTGARRTNVAPVWLPTPQIHLLQAEATFSAEHEVAHVLAREFGGPLNASLALGLVEGLAVALAPPDGWPPPHELVAASERVLAETTGTLPDALARRAAAVLSPLRFWTARGTVAYMTSGSFAQWLLETYGAEAFREAYRSSRFEPAYGWTAEELAAQWASFIRRQEVGPEARAFAERLFTQPSLFEVRCPHHVPSYVAHTRDGFDALERGDAEIALSAFEEALTERPTYSSALDGLTRAAFTVGSPDQALAPLSLAMDEGSLADPLVWARWGAAQRVLGEDRLADSAFATAVRRIPSYSSSARASLQAQGALHASALLDLLSHGTAEGRARALEGAGRRSPEAYLFAAQAWIEAGDPGLALGALRRVPAGPESAVPQRVRRRWMAEAAYLGGDLDLAVLLAADAVRRFRRAGEEVSAREADRFRERVAWLARHPEARLGRLPAP